MTRSHVIAVLVVVAFAAALVAGCERTADSTTAERVATGEPACQQVAAPEGASCEQAGDGCAGCPAMQGSETATADARPTTCSHAEDGSECPEGCTCSKTVAADGSVTCDHDATSSGCKATGACPHAAADNAPPCCAKPEAKTATDGRS